MGQQEWSLLKIHAADSETTRPLETDPTQSTRRLRSLFTLTKPTYPSYLSHSTIPSSHYSTLRQTASA